MKPGKDAVPWIIAALCAVVLIGYTTFMTVYFVHTVPRVVVVRIEVPGFGGVR